MKPKQWIRASAPYQALFPGIRPSAICIGAQKSGTTALWEYLAEHPGTVPSRIKELDFFNCNARYARGENFYHSFFPHRTAATRGKIGIDVTPGYLGFAHRAAPRIKAYDAGIKLIALLRDPAKRAYSAWQMYRKGIQENRAWYRDWTCYCDGDPNALAEVDRPASFGASFVDDVAFELAERRQGRTVEMPLLHASRYGTHLKHYYELFPAGQILIVSTEEMSADTRGTLRAIEDFLGLEHHAWPDAALRPRFSGDYSEPMPPEAKALLAEHLHDEKAAAMKLAGRTFPWM